MQKKLLIVEDSRSFRQQLMIVLEKDYDVLSAEDGREGLDTLQKNQDIAMIITDVNMPVMNGLDMVDEIKKKALFNGPIMILTTEGNRETIDRGRAMGVSCWLVKPFEPACLLSAVRKLLGS